MLCIEISKLGGAFHRQIVEARERNAPCAPLSVHLLGKINLRNNNNYKFSNLYLITDLEYPNGKTLIDTLEYKMAEPDGKLLGEGFTDVKENKLWYKGYKSPFIFKESGTYTFRVKHAMRAYGEVEGLDDLDGVTEVGFRVENK